MRCLQSISLFAARRVLTVGTWNANPPKTIATVRRRRGARDDCFQPTATTTSPFTLKLTTRRFYFYTYSTPRIRAKYGKEPGVKLILILAYFDQPRRESTPARAKSIPYLY